MSSEETSRAFFSMNSLRGSTWSPISFVKISSASVSSPISTRRSSRDSGFIAVSHSCSGFISPRPLYRWIVCPFFAASSTWPSRHRGPSASGKLPSPSSRYGGRSGRPPPRAQREETDRGKPAPLRARSPLLQPGDLREPPREPLPRERPRAVRPRHPPSGDPQLDEVLMETNCHLALCESAPISRSDTSAERPNRLAGPRGLRETRHLWVWPLVYRIDAAFDLTVGCWNKGHDY